MQKIKSNDITVLHIIKSSLGTLFEHKAILFPFCVIIFAQLLLLEILYFSVRYPLNIFFAPIISKLWSDSFLHYPMNFILLPKLFQYGQIPLFIFVNSFFTGIAVAIIEAINSERNYNLKAIIKNNRWTYLHLMVNAMVIFFCVWAYAQLYGMIIERALQIRSAHGIFGLLKRVVLDGGPFFNLIYSIIITTVFIYVCPIIVIEKKRFFQALIMNFKMLFKSFGLTFMLVLTPSLIYIPIILLRNTFPFETVMPIWHLVTLVLSIFVVAAIDSVVYTAITVVYLLKKDH